jgi:hypothetical protein
VHQKILSLSSLAKNDPYPLYVSSYPYNWLLQSTKNYLKGLTCEYKRDLFSVAFSGFYQKANRGSDYDRQRAFIGDLEGYWHMLGMTYGIVPGPNAFPPTLVGTQLGLAKTMLFSPLPNEDSTVPNNRILVDPNQQIGFFSVPIKYRKHGVRFEFCVQPTEDFGLVIEGGYADIKQTLTQLINRGDGVETLPPLFTETFTTLVYDLLMSPSAADCIFREQGIDKRSNTQNICDFRSGSFEDLRFKVWARHIFQVNEQADCEWPEFLFIPFFALEGTAPTSKTRDTMNFLSLPFGNNGHGSVGFAAGFHIDFVETIEIGFHGGWTHFFARDIDNYRLPNHKTQSGVFPFATNVRVQPGDNHEFSVKMHAYRFLDKLSAHVEFIFVNHAEDSITLKDPNLGPPIFDPYQQECLTKFTSQFLNTAINYEISPNLSLGFLAQWPLQQRNAYRSTTVLGTIKAVF